MCTKTKSSPTPTPPVQKPPVYLRNMWLDGLGINAESRGRNSLRIEPGFSRPAQAAAASPVVGGLGIAQTPYRNLRIGEANQISTQ